MAADSAGDGSVGVDVSEFILQQSRLVSLERTEDISNATASVQRMSEKEAIKAGLCLARLQLTDCKAGLYGRCLVTFTPTSGDFLPATQIGVRDIVHIAHKRAPSAADGSNAAQQWWKDGVVYRQNERSVTVAVEDYPELQQRVGQFSLTRVANEVVYTRYSAALQTLRDRGVHGSNSNRALQVLYGGAAPSVQKAEADVHLSPSGIAQRLNEKQQRAVSRALSCNDVFVLHGPPGTGKTTSLVEIVVQCVARGERVLACAPSNIAVDNLVERITAASAFNASHASSSSARSSSSSSFSSSTAFHAFRCIRLGHPARLSPAALSHSLDSVVAQSDGGQITRDIERELTATQQSMNTTKDRAEKRTLRGQWKALQKELRERQRKAVKDVLDGCSVTCATLIGAASSACSSRRYDVVVIDEAAQAIECACLIPILLCQHRLVLAGDHHQLGPVVKSDEAQRGGLGRTLLDRVSARSDRAELVLMLDEQYRMNASIMAWSSNEFYHGQLSAPDSVRQRTLTQLKGVLDDPLTRAPIVFIDTAGCDMLEDADDPASSSTPSSLFSQSKSNQHEVALVLRHVRHLLAAHVPQSSITVLSPYLAQISLLRDALLPLYPALEVGTIDSMQGRENDAVLISMVRSNEAHVVGFLSESRRMNVAVTRARCHVCLVGDSETLSHDAFLKRLVDYIADHDSAEYISAMEYQDGGIVEKTPAVHSAAPPSKPPATSPAPTPTAAAPTATPARSVVRDPTADVIAPTAAAPVAGSFDRARIAGLCNELLSGQRSAFIFPASLSVDDRRTVHEVAEEVGKGALSHLSEGQKHRRVITLRRQPLPLSVPTVSAPPPAVPPAKKPNSSREEQRMAALARMEAAAKSQQNSAPPATAESLGSFAHLHIADEVDGDEDEERKLPDTADVGNDHSVRALPPAPSSKKKSKGKSARGAAPAPPAAAAEDDEGLDGFLDSLSKGVSVCASPACSRSVMVNGACCGYCRLRFCLAHANGILHGCAADAKEAALARDLHTLHASKQGRSLSGLKPGKREQLRTKVQAKADALRKAGEAPGKKNKSDGSSA